MAAVRGESVLHFGRGFSTGTAPDIKTDRCNAVFIPGVRHEMQHSAQGKSNYISASTETDAINVVLSLILDLIVILIPPTFIKAF